MDSGVKSGRNELFQELKPICVEVSQLAHKQKSTSKDNKLLLEATNRLLTFLEQKCRRTDSALDERLADYVFFPLSQILRGKQRYTDRLSEITVNCLKILLEYGWRKSVSLDLAKQLLILLTFVAGGAPGQEDHQVPEESLISAYGALAALFRAVANTPGGSSALSATDILPALGHCVTTILNGVTDGPSPAAELEALSALDAAWRAIKDHETLSKFLPGTVSALTKSLMPGTTNRKTRQALVKSLGVFELILVSTLSDIRCRSIIKDNESHDKDPPAKDVQQNPLTRSWLKATADQIKLALSNVIRLRNHKSSDVTKALNRLCLIVLDECHQTLADSRSLLVETCLSLNEVESTDDMTSSRTSLADLAAIHSDIAEAIRGTVYNWVTSLPRVMQSSDETKKRDALNNLAQAHRLLLGLSQSSAILESALVASLRDSVTATLEASPHVPKRLLEAEMDVDRDAAALVRRASSITKFPPILMAEAGQVQTRQRFESFLATLGDWNSQISIAGGLLEFCLGASGPSRLSAYWLSSQILRSAASTNKDLYDFLDPSVALSDEQVSLQQDLFSYSQSLLFNSDETASDWRLQATALEVVADTACHMKEDFRNELVDTLFLVTQSLGSRNPKLREHAIICLNIIARECGYGGVSDLIVGNADYMVNSISLKLDTFDISPQLPQILTMLIRLTGPSLLSYLDDVVASVFAALDNFHGYEALVETLFSVLGEIVEVGSNSEQMLPIDWTTDVRRKSGGVHTTIDDIIHLIQKQQENEVNHPSLEHEDFPRKPWKDAKTLLDEADAPPADEEEADNSATQVIQPVPPPKVYTMIQNIVHLSQHYLTNRSPILRAKLLRLILTACKSLQSRESSFLPLINDIWPVVIKRLYDDEPFVKIAAAEAIAELCRGAGDFMTTRIQVEWNDLIRLARQARARDLNEKKGGGGMGIYSQTHRVSEAVVRLLIAIVEYVRIEGEMFDDVLDVLKDLLPTRDDVKDALSTVNADAVWLSMLSAGTVQLGQTPIFEGYKFTDLGIVT